MEKLMQYVKGGKGRGLIFLLAAAVVMSFVGVYMLRQIYGGIEPQIMLTADEFLPITVENGKIVSPENVYKKIDFKFGEAIDNSDVLPIVLDTQSETTTVPDAKVGIFIMKDIVYMITPTKIEKVYLSDGVWDKDKIKGFLDSFISMFSFVMTVLMVVFFFLFLLIKTLIIAWLSKVGLKVMQKNTLPDFAGLMRLSALVIAIFDVIMVCISFGLGFSLNGWVRALISLMIVMGILLRTEEENA